GGRCAGRSGPGRKGHHPAARGPGSVEYARGRAPGDVGPPFQRNARRALGRGSCQGRLIPRESFRFEWPYSNRKDSESEDWSMTAATGFHLRLSRVEPFPFKWIHSNVRLSIT